MSQNNNNLSDEVLALRLGREGARSGELTISLIWNDVADLDLHVYTPDKEHIYYGHKESECGGWLDVDMNVSLGPTNSLEPVENVFWHSAPSGTYIVEVHNFNCHVKENSTFTDPKRFVPFRCVVKRGGKVEAFEGTVQHGTPVTAFIFDHQGTGAVGSYVVLPGGTEKTTFKESCEKHGVTYNVGTGYYAVARTETIQASKNLLLHHIPTDTFTIGKDAVRKKLGWPEGELKKSPKDIPEGHRLFVQSTSYNRVIPPGTHVLVKVKMEEALKYRASSLAAASPNTGNAPQPPPAAAAASSSAAPPSPKTAAKAPAKPAAKPKPKAKPAARAKPTPKAAPAPKASPSPKAKAAAKAKPTAKPAPKKRGAPVPESAPAAKRGRK